MSDLGHAHPCRTRLAADLDDVAGFVAVRDRIDGAEVRDDALGDQESGRELLVRRAPNAATS